MESLFPLFLSISQYNFSYFSQYFQLQWEMQFFSREIQVSPGLSDRLSADSSMETQPDSLLSCTHYLN